MNNLNNLRKNKEIFYKIKQKKMSAQKDSPKKTTRRKVYVEPVEFKNVRGQIKYYLKVFTEDNEEEYFITVGQKTFNSVKKFQYHGAENTV